MMSSIKVATLIALMLFPSVAFAECVATPRSSWISELCYEPSKVTATMSGSMYNFCGISRSLLDEWVNAPSVGSFYNQRIKGRYRC